MRIALDTEFYENGKTIDLISIGLVRSDGETYYAEVQGAGLLAESSDWLLENVRPHLTGPRKSKSQIAMEVVEFVDLHPEFWAWYGSYDWVALCQLYGRMIDLPPTWPMFIRDFRQTTFDAVLNREMQVAKQSVELDGPEHHALSDAKWLDRAMSEWEISIKERYINGTASVKEIEDALRS